MKDHKVDIFFGSLLIENPWLLCDFSGAVFNLLCNDMEIMLMGKIQNHFASQITEVRFLL